MSNIVQFPIKAVVKAEAFLSHAQPRKSLPRIPSPRRFSASFCLTDNEPMVFSVAYCKHHFSRAEVASILREAADKLDS